MQCEWNDIGCYWDAFWQQIADFFVWVLEGILSGAAAVLEAIPVPEWAGNLGTFSLPEGVLWFAQALELGYGASVLASAMAIRFLIRRLPVVG